MISDILSRLKGVHKTGTGWQARCPGHDDVHASLSIAEGVDGRILVNCHAGCTFDHIVYSVGLKPSDFFGGSVIPEGVTLQQLSGYTSIDQSALSSFGLHEQANNSGAPQVVIPYADEVGLFIRDKIRNKLSGPAKFTWGPGKGAHVYGQWWLPEARKNGWLIVTEGESDAWAMWRAGIPAIALPGASMVKLLLRMDLEDVESIWVAHDNDEAGEKMMTALSHMLSSGDISVRPLPIPSEYNDVLEWYKGKGIEGFTKSVMSIINDEDTRVIGLADLLDMDMDEPDFIVEDLLPMGLTLCCAPPKSGKSFLAAEIARACASGDKAFDLFKTKKGRVLYLDLEMARDVARSRWRSVMRGSSTKATNDMMVASEWDIMNRGGLADIKKQIKADPSIILVIVDTKERFWPDNPRSYCPDGNAYDIDSAIMNVLHDFAKEMNIALLIVHHTNKGEIDPLSPFDSVSGSQGLMAKADTGWMLRRSHNSPVANLYTTSRVIGNDDITLTFELEKGGWIATDKQKQVYRTKKAWEKDVEQAYEDEQAEADEGVEPPEQPGEGGVQGDTTREEEIIPF
jgi:hypothetical protein